MTRYSQYAADERGRSSGLGLRLYIAHQIITAHRGTIKVASTRDQGVTFSVRLLLTR
ncbi:MAG: hypothetical protein NVSMB6_24210 [Burkholderiaceae bacterium]